MVSFFKNGCGGVGNFCRGLAGLALLFLSGVGYAVAAGESATGAVPAKVASSNLPPVVVLPAVTNKTELEKMKDEFVELMGKRAELREQYRQSQERIVAARRVTPDSPAAKGETAGKVREANMAVERALDVHPKVVAFQRECDLVQTQKLAVSYQHASALEARMAVDKASEAAYRAKVEVAKAKATTASDAYYKGLGFTGDLKHDKAMRDLTEAETNQLMGIQDQMLSELAELKKTRDSLKQEAREKDERVKQLAALGKQYGDFEAQQKEMHAQMLKLRRSLRESDPAIAALNAAAIDASRAHVQSAEANPEMAEAKRVLGAFGGMQDEIDRRARVLRREILQKDPDSKGELDKQAKVAGLALVGEDFWNVQN